MALCMGTFLATMIIRLRDVPTVLTMVVWVHGGGMNIIDMAVLAVRCVLVMSPKIGTGLLLKAIDRLFPLGAMLVMTCALNTATWPARPWFLALATFRMTIPSWRLS